MPQTSAKIVTLSGSKYLQQLCKHWSHKFAVEFDADQGRIPFAEDQLITLTAEPDHLLVTITAGNADDLPRLETVLANHLVRFAFREELVFDWQRAL